MSPTPAASPESGTTLYSVWTQELSTKTRKLGTLEVSEIGYGTMSFASTYGTSPDRKEAIRVIRGAHDLGVTFFDTAEVYGPFTNEELVGEALAPVRAEVIIASKFGWNVDPDTGERRPGLNSRPEHIRRAVEGMLERVRENIGAAGIVLNAGDLERIARVASRLEVHGARLPEAILQFSYK